MWVIFFLYLKNWSKITKGDRKMIWKVYQMGIITLNNDTPAPHGGFLGLPASWPLSRYSFPLPLCPWSPLQEHKLRAIFWAKSWKRKNWCSLSAFRFWIPEVNSLVKANSTAARRASSVSFWWEKFRHCERSLKSTVSLCSAVSKSSKFWGSFL